METPRQLPARVPWVDAQGLITESAARSLRPLYVMTGQDIQLVTVGTSPYVYTALAEGVLYIGGGTISGRSFIRGSSSITLNSNDNTLQMRQGDQVSITYTVAPTVNFAPR